MQVDETHAAEGGPELALNFLSLRFALSALGQRTAAPPKDRRFLFSVGFGYF